MSNLHPLQFTHGTDKAEPPHHFVEAKSASGETVGVMKWHATKEVKAHGTGEKLKGTISDIHTAPEHRGKGIATAMWNHAHNEAGLTPPPMHSPSRTPEGDKWAKKVGGKRPMTASQASLMFGDLSKEQFQ